MLADVLEIAQHNVQLPDDQFFVVQMMSDKLVFVSAQDSVQRSQLSVDVDLRMNVKRRLFRDSLEGENTLKRNYRNCINEMFHPRSVPLEKLIQRKHVILTRFEFRQVSQLLDSFSNQHQHTSGCHVGIFCQ